MGTKSPRSQALELHHAGHAPPAIAKALRVDVEQVNTWVWGPPRKAINRKSAPRSKPRAISPASKAQREKVSDGRSITGAEGPCDPAHIWPRSLGGCDDPLCVVPLLRQEHRAFDEGELDLLPFLVVHHVPELQHALAHARGDLIALLERVTGDRWASADEASKIAIAAAEDALREAA